MLSLGAHAAAEKKVYVDVETDSIHFPVQTLLMIWHHDGDWEDLLRFAGRENIHVVGGWHGLNPELTYESPVLSFRYNITPHLVAHFRRVGR